MNDLMIRPMGNGGHTVFHGGMAKHFGPSEGHDMLAHVANHLDIPAEAPKLTPNVASAIRAKVNGR